MKRLAVQKSANLYFSGFAVFLVLVAANLVFGLNRAAESKVPMVFFGLAMTAVSPFSFIGWRKKQACADILKPHPECVLTPVAYDQWSGSVHSFRFASRVFCRELARANARKVLGQ